MVTMTPFERGRKDYRNAWKPNELLILESPYPEDQQNTKQYRAGWFYERTQKRKKQ